MMGRVKEVYLVKEKRSWESFIKDKGRWFLNKQQELQCFRRSDWILVGESSPRECLKENVDQKKKMKKKKNKLSSDLVFIIFKDG